MLEFKNITAACQHQIILKNISITVPTGEITCIVGPNGCGKTTLVQCLYGISKVIEGTILLNGCDFLKLSYKERAKQLSFLPQVRQIIPTLPVKTLVEHGRFPYLGFARKKQKTDIDIVNQVMDFTQTTPYSNMSADALSGGIRQQVFFAMNLAQNCDTIVLDEPTTYLDINRQHKFYEDICTLKQQGKTILLVIHDLSYAVRIADYLIVMDNRKIAAQGKPEILLEQHVIENVFHVKCKHFKDEEGEYFLFL